MTSFVILSALTPAGLCLKYLPSIFLFCLKESHISSRLSSIPLWNFPQSCWRVICFYPSVPIALCASTSVAILIEFKIQNSFCIYPIGKCISWKGGLYPPLYPQLLIGCLASSRYTMNGYWMNKNMDEWMNEWMHERILPREFFCVCHKIVTFKISNDSRPNFKVW